MSSQYRQTCLLILLAVLAGHALLALHASSHVSSERQACELCTHYSGFEHAPAPAAPEAFPRALSAPAPVRFVVFLATPPVAHRHQRGPPAAG